MTQKHLNELLAEIETALRGDAITVQDRAMLEQVRADLQTSLAGNTKDSGLRSTLSATIERLEGEYPQLTSVLSKTLDVLSDVGL